MPLKTVNNIYLCWVGKKITYFQKLILDTAILVTAPVQQLKSLERKQTILKFLFLCLQFSETSLKLQKKYFKFRYYLKVSSSEKFDQSSSKFSSLSRKKKQKISKTKQRKKLFFYGNLKIPKKSVASFLTLFILGKMYGNSARCMFRICFTTASSHTLSSLGNKSTFLKHFSVSKTAVMYHFLCC